jgi:hypothetical protein
MRQSRKLSRVLLLGAVLLSLPAAAQTTIGGTPGPVNPNAYLQLGDSLDNVTGVPKATKGLLLPRVALTATNAATPLDAHVAGMTVYNTAATGDVTPGYYYNDGTQWVRLASASNDWHIDGNEGTTPGTHFLGTTDNPSSKNVMSCCPSCLYG